MPGNLSLVALLLPLSLFCIHESHAGVRCYGVFLELFCRFRENTSFDWTGSLGGYNNCATAAKRRRLLRLMLQLRSTTAHLRHLRPHLDIRTTTRLQHGARPNDVI